MLGPLKGVVTYCCLAIVFVTVAARTKSGLLARGALRALLPEQGERYSFRHVFPAYKFGGFWNSSYRLTEQKALPTVGPQKFTGGFLSDVFVENRKSTIWQALWSTSPYDGSVRAGKL